MTWSGDNEWKGNEPYPPHPHRHPRRRRRREEGRKVMDE